MRGSPPLRFLAVVLGGWAALRTAIIAPPWPTPAAEAADAGSARPLRPSGRKLLSPTPPAPRGAASGEGPRAPATVPIRLAGRSAAQPPLIPGGIPPAAPEAGGRPGGVGFAGAEASPLEPQAEPPGAAVSRRARPGRWTLSAWSFVRRGDAEPLAAGGFLGGSQAGARLLYRINADRGRPLALSVRAAAPLRRPAEAEAAIGLDWRPSRRLPVHLLAERRQGLGERGRSALALTLYGGVDGVRVGHFRIDAYGQAGLVGARSRDPFADASVRLSLPLGERLRVGAGAWAAAQPGASRLDLGPQAALSLPLAGRPVTLAADWRLRVAGDARPGSGPALTLATDF